MFNPDESQKHALLTWYNINHPLHFDARHPAIALAGEVGELLDLLKKEEYKPNFSWWNCKHCGQTEDDIFHGQEKYSHQYTPLILDELGDYSYYLRILAYQEQVTFEELYTENDSSQRVLNEDELFYHLIKLSEYSIEVLKNYYYHSKIMVSQLADCTYRFLAILHKLNIPLSQVLELNYKKLNSNEDAHGWKSATIKTRS